LRSFEDVSSALNLDSDGLQIVGGCDLYTTKAAGSDKKLYKQIDRKLEAQHESLLRLAASLSPPQAAQFAKTSNLSQSSPFGTLSQVSNRRTYAYMIATLNASHPDYDFSHVLRPSDFRREKRIRDVMNDVDSKVYGAQKTSIPRGIQTPGGTLLWGPRMWNLIDAEMDVFDCEVFSYKPEENPFDDEETALWSVHYFFFNKSRKRVCYLYLRALSPCWHGGDDDLDEDDGSITPIRPKRSYSARRSVDFSARKRARYWLGDRADDLEDEWDTETQLVDADEGDDEVEIDVEVLNEIVKRSRSMSSNMSSSDANDELDQKERSKPRVRAMSDAVAESIEL
jgi:hypothetical protein